MKTINISIRFREVLLVSITGEILKTFNGVKEAADFYKTSPRTLRDKINKNKVVWKDGTRLVLGELKNQLIEYGDKKEYYKNKRNPFYCKICGETKSFKFYPYNKHKCKKCLSTKYSNLSESSFYDKMTIQKTWRENNFIHCKVLGAKARAKKRKFEFEISDEIIEKKLIDQNGLCYISKQKLNMNENDWYGLSLDRLDSSIGYTIDNTILVTKFVNISKNALSLENYMKFLKEIVDNTNISN
jgi:hypothetical protein